jgi:hypothetical protein
VTIDSRIIAALLLAGLSLAVACEGAPNLAPMTFAAPDSPPKPPATSGALPMPGFDSPCGYEAPAVGTDCAVTRNSQVPWEGTCEYGHDLDSNCNTTFECTGIWQMLPQSSCSRSYRCPDTIGEIAPGSPCSDVSFGCSYLEGTCACVADPGSIKADGGDTMEAGAGGRWRCTPPPEGDCPAQRPSIGSDCVRPMTCDYGSCALQRDLVYSCLAGWWVQGDSPVSCP